MSWASLGSNDAVTRDNLQDAFNNGVFTAKTFVSGSQCITKAEAYSYAYIDTSYYPYSIKSSSDLVVKGDLVSSGGIET